MALPAAVARMACDTRRRSFTRPPPLALACIGPYQSPLAEFQFLVKRGIWGTAHSLQVYLRVDMLRS